MAKHIPSLDICQILFVVFVNSGIATRMDHCLQVNPMKSRRKTAKKSVRPTHELAVQHNKQSAALRAKILADSKSRKDLQFLTTILGWSCDDLIQRLLYDVRRFSPDFGSFPLHGVDKDLSQDYYFWKALPQHAIDLAHEIEKANKSKLSPASNLIHYDVSGQILPKRELKKVTVLYKRLPEILRSWALELKTKVDINKSGLTEDKKEWPVLKQLTLTDSLEESVFAKAGKYYQSPLYRLLAAAAGVLNIRIVSERAFRVRLNRQKKALSRRS